MIVFVIASPRPLSTLSFRARPPCPNLVQPSPLLPPPTPSTTPPLSQDWRRNAAFASFDCFYLGGVQYGIYVKAFGRLFPTSRTFTSKSVAEKLKDKVGMKETGYQVFLDQFVHHPLLYFPVFYATKEIVVNKDEPDLYRAIGERERERERERD